MQLPTWAWILNQFTTMPAVVQPDLSGRVIVVTGANIGLGYEAALHLSRCNAARLIIAVRNIKAGQEAAQKITEANGGKCVPEVWELDLGRLESVKAFGQRVDKELPRLDVFLSNAGIANMAFKTTSDGYEATSQVNNIANSLLSVLVLPNLLRTAAEAATVGISTPYPGFKPHLTIVASEVHYWVKPAALPGVKEGRTDLLQAMQEEELFVSDARYNESKLINVLNVHTLAELVGQSVIVNAVTPGLCWSSLHRDFSGPVGIFVTGLKYAMARTTEQGSRTEIWASTQPTPSGAFSDRCTVSEPLDWTFSPEGKQVGAKLWADMCEL